MTQLACISDFEAAERRKQLRVINPKRKQCTPIQASTDVNPPLNEVERAWEWLVHNLTVKSAQHKCSKSIFGVVTFYVPFEECNPKIVEKILLKLGVNVISTETTYNLSNNVPIEVAITCDTPEIGVLNMPIF